jgi:hypothetical protein
MTNNHDLNGDQISDHQAEPSPIGDRSLNDHPVNNQPGRCERIPAKGHPHRSAPASRPQARAVWAAASHPHRAQVGARVPARGRAERDPVLAGRLTDRDLCLLAALEEAQALQTGQIGELLMYSNPRTCQARLTKLRQLGVLQRFRLARPSGGSYPWNWTLGLAGARIQAATHNRQPPTPAAHDERVRRLTYSPSLNHLVTTNDFFVRLAIAAWYDNAVSLDRWWSEHTTALLFSGIQPDAHGLWTERGAGGTARTVGWWLDTDLGTEPQTRLIGKLDAYERLAATGGPRYPVLFWMTSTQRERNLHELLRQRSPQIQVATAVQTAHPAARAWWLAGTSRRVALHDLPSDHGPQTATNSNWANGQLDLTSQEIGVTTEQLALHVPAPA